jgi:cytochrome c biogenesis protein CcmG/thiol:disulfide interchange protein DsbE
MSKLYILILAMTLFAGCSRISTSASEELLEVKLKPLAERQQAPSFELKDSNGTVVTLAEYKDRVVLLNFWATWCVPCKEELPWFQEFNSKFKDQGFAVLGVSLDEEGWNVVKPYTDERKLTYRMVMGSEQVSTLYGGIDSLPTTFLIDRAGKIAAIHTGLVSKATYEKEIQDILKGATHASVSGDVVAAVGAADFRAK